MKERLLESMGWRTQPAIDAIVIVHEYFGIDQEIVWGVIERNLPDLKLRVLKALDQR